MDQIDGSFFDLMNFFQDQKFFDLKKWKISCFFSSFFFSRKKIIGTYLSTALSFFFPEKIGRKKKTRPTYLYLEKVPKYDVPPRKKKLSAFAVSY